MKLTKKARAIKLRDEALKMVRSKGTLSPILTGKKVVYQTLTYRSGDLQIYFRTPFQPLPKPSNAAKHDAGVMGKPLLPHSLDVSWPNKVLNIEWDDAGSVHVVGFRPGEWEGKLAALAAHKGAH